ncbi:hypothetical protein B0H16DRAFT_1718231 [Mycena metata]|uniref:Uncharacterized protein n=1 Tax=Mycena metata TaxID=1033252 RepID=A0AAD7JI18_9AGAR|nr:hypothetical protein B0H16DRAFT_1718231 [Mycena metata]
MPTVYLRFACRRRSGWRYTAHSSLSPACAMGLLATVALSRSLCAGSPPPGVVVSVATLPHGCSSTAVLLFLFTSGLSGVRTYPLSFRCLLDHTPHSFATTPLLMARILSADDEEVFPSPSRVPTSLSFILTRHLFLAASSLDIIRASRTWTLILRRPGSQRKVMRRIWLGFMKCFSPQLTSVSFDAPYSYSVFIVPAQILSCLTTAL